MKSNEESSEFKFSVRFDEVTPDQMRDDAIRDPTPAAQRGMRWYDIAATVIMVALIFSLIPIPHSIGAAGVFLFLVWRWRKNQIAEGDA